MVRSNKLRRHGDDDDDARDDGLIRLDAEGRQELRISPASAFKRPQVVGKNDGGGSAGSESGILGNVCPPPLVKKLDNNSNNSNSNTNNSTNTSDKPVIELHPCLKASNWKALCAKLEQLQRHQQGQGDNDNIFRVNCALSAENDQLETTLHTAAWKCPTEITLRMLELTPADERKRLLLRRDIAGNTVLHLCCANLDDRVEFTVIKNVLLLAPEALEMVNSFGDTPLHLLVCSPGFQQSPDFTVEIAAEEAVTSLLSLVKEQGTVQNKLGLTLLHCAIAHGSHERVLVQLLAIVPQAASVPDGRGMLPLHYAAAFGGTPWTFVQKLIQAHPAALLAPTENGDTPLHLLIVNAERQLNEAGLLDRNTTKLAELLLSTPNDQKCALFMPNNEMLYPLHCCAIFDSPPQLTRILMECPDAVAASVIPTHSGWTPLHLACVSSSGNLPTDNAEALATQRACKMFDSNDRTPLMLALERSHSVSAQLVKFLLQCSPKSAVLPTRKGKFLPLHIALGRNVKESVIQRLVNACPASLLAQTSSGDTALHIACRRGVAISTVKFLLSKRKEARSIRNKRNELPIDLAQWHGLAADIPELSVIPTSPQKRKASIRSTGTLSSNEDMHQQQDKFVVSFR